MLEKLDEAEEFLSVYHLPKLKPEAISNLKRPITWNVIEAVIRLLPSKTSSGLDGVNAEFYQIFMEILPNSFFLISWNLS